MAGDNNLDGAALRDIAGMIKAVSTKAASILLPWPVLMETYYITLQEKGRAEADRRYALLRQLRAETLLSMDEPILLTAAVSRRRHRVPLADAVVAAFAIRNNAVLIRKDPEFDTLACLQFPSNIFRTCQ